MDYRKYGRGDELISTIGLGLGNIHTSADAEIQAVFEYAAENGINFYDLCLGNMNTYKIFGSSEKGARKNFYTQMHFGISYETGEYGRVRDFETVRTWFEKALEATKMDYTDFGFVHCVDEHEELDTIMTNGTWDYMLDLKKQGVIKHIGISTHTPEIAKRLIDTGETDFMMFSINPAYDYNKGDMGYGKVNERTELYQLCEKLGIGISIMKPFCGGQLLDVRTSPLNVALTHNQCIKYGLDRPAVVTSLPGVNTVEDVKQVLKYYEATDEEKDYSIIGTATPSEAKGRCVYCSHCAPCPQGINVSLVNKYYDLAKLGDSLAKDHYKQLSLHAEDCVQCGICNTRCPFAVTQTDRMLEIKDYFGF